LCDRRVGLLAAAFAALTVLHVQQAHFYTADSLLGFLTLAALLFATRLAEGSRATDAWFAGAWAGLALGTKASAALLAFPLAAACSLASRKRHGCYWRVGLAALGAFALTNPFALINPRVFARNVAGQAAIVRGLLVVPYTWQYRDTLPYIYPVVQQLRWGIGWIPGLVGLGALVLAVGRTVRTPPRAGEWVILAWALPSIAFVGALYAKFPRYLLPVTPLLGVYAAALVLDLTWPRRWRLCASSIALLGPMLFRCLLLVGPYGSPHPWLAASDWFYENVEPGVTIATEEWDHPLPLDATGYDVRQLPVFEPETPAKWTEIEATLKDADYLVIASRRAYATLGRLSEAFPRTSGYYQRLFDGELAFEPVACYSRSPGPTGLVLVDDPTSGLAFDLPASCRAGAMWILIGHLDESFVVYDRPQVLVFKALP